MTPFSKRQRYCSSSLALPREPEDGSTLRDMSLCPRRWPSAVEFNNSHARISCARPMLAGLIP